ncbi:MAG: response regulator, partial [Nakamurella sp.]
MAHLLVVEDDAAMRELLVELFQEEGYNVRLAGDGRAALHAIAQWSPDVIVLDWHMPGIDGEEFARIYRALPPPHAPIVLLTGSV